MGLMSDLILGWVETLGLVVVVVDLGHQIVGLSHGGALQKGITQTPPVGQTGPTTAHGGGR